MNLVTGEAGFIGPLLIERFEREEVDVHVLDNSFAGRLNHLPSTVSWEEVDICDADDVTIAVHNYDPTIIAHLAAIHHTPYCNS